MLSSKPMRLKLALTASLLAFALPVLGQDSPESLLPPGFGDPVEDNKPPPKPRTDGPQDLLPDDLVTGGNVKPPTQGTPVDGTTGVGATGLATGDLLATEDGELGDEELVAPVLQDLPAHARRSTSNIGVLAIFDGDMGAAAFGASNGPYLSYLMHKTPAPIASRWASITLRRALLSKVASPAALNGVDFAADRAWLLLRMGEADSARMLVQAVDADQYTPWMRTVALQTALANADPAGACPSVDGNPATAKEPYWKLARGFCSAFAGESALASALVDQVRDNGSAASIDVLLAEKIVGAAGNTRRSVNVLWENVDKLTAWRFGLASATALKIPAPLMATVGPRVRAWRARAPLLPAQDRTADVELATAMGVFSSAALIDHYGVVAEISEASGTSPAAHIDALETAFSGADVSAKISAMESIWTSAETDQAVRYARFIATARAAAMIPADGDDGGEVDNLIAAMMSAGLDVQAARWTKHVSDGGLGWALLAVGSPQKFSSISNGSVSGFDAGESGKRAQFLLAGLAGLGRLNPDAVSGLADDMDVPLGRVTPWTKAINRAADAREPATVAVLAAIGLHADSWNGVSPLYLYHAVSALRRVGLEAEARMIAAEAVMRG